MGYYIYIFKRKTTWFYTGSNNSLHTRNGVLACTYLLKKLNPVKPFTGHEFEKNNDSARYVVLRKSNKKDAAADVLKLESRQWKL